MRSLRQNILETSNGNAEEPQQDALGNKEWFNNGLAWGAGLFLAVPIAIAVAPVAVGAIGALGGLAFTAAATGLVFAGSAYLANLYEENIEKNVLAKYDSSQKELGGKRGGEEGATNIGQKLSVLERGLRDTTVEAALEEFTDFFNILFQGGAAADVEAMRTRFNLAQAKYAAAAEARATAAAAAAAAEVAYRGGGGGGGTGRPADAAKPLVLIESEGPPLPVAGGAGGVADRLVDESGKAPASAAGSREGKGPPRADALDLADTDRSSDSP